MAKRSARKKAGLGPPPRRTPPPVRSAGTPRPRTVDRRWLVAGVVVVLAIVGIVLGVVLTRGSSSASTAAPIKWDSIPGLQTGPPPWD